LLLATKDEDPQVQEEAIAALEKIDTEAAAKAGIK